MKVFISLLTLTLGFIVAGSTADGQNRQLSGGLGLSDAEWKDLFGPRPQLPATLGLIEVVVFTRVLGIGRVRLPGAITPVI
jgi:hypothetical protein